MSTTLRICLKSGDRIFVNGAVLRADRKVTLEILNDVTFLLEHHFISEQEANTPMRRLYHLVQTMLTEPHNAAATRHSCDMALQILQTRHRDGELAERFEQVAELIARDRSFEALKAIRCLFPFEDRKLLVSA